MPSNVIIVTEFMFLGINMFWALLRAHFNPRLTARAKMSLSRAQNIFMPANINSIVLVFSNSNSDIRDLTQQDGWKTQDGRMTKNCRARPGMHSLTRHFFFILSS